MEALNNSQGHNVERGDPPLPMEDLCLNILREAQLFRSKLDAMNLDQLFREREKFIRQAPVQAPQEEDGEEDGLKKTKNKKPKRGNKKRPLEQPDIEQPDIEEPHEEAPPSGGPRGFKGAPRAPFFAPPARDKKFLPAHIQSRLDSNKYQVGDHVLVDMTNIPGWNRFMFCHLSGVVTATNLILKLPPHSRKDPRPAPLVPGPLTKEGGYSISIPSVLDANNVAEVVYVFADRLQKDHTPLGGQGGYRLSTLYDTFLRAISEPRIIVEGEINPSSLLVHVKVEEGGVVGWWEAYLMSHPCDISAQIGFQIVWFGDYHKHGKFAFAPLNDIRPAF
jgi:hypothetical protein